MWTIERIESFGFKLITSHKQWCRFRGHGFDVYINIDTAQTKGNLFTFKSVGNSFKGNFKARLTTDEDMEFILIKIV